MSVSVSLGRARVLLTLVWLVHESEYDFALALVCGSDGGPESSKDFIVVDINQTVRSCH